MPKREQLMQETVGEHNFGVLLTLQMSGVPNEVQLIIETAEYDPQRQGLKPKQAYIVRALGVREHMGSVGMFARLLFVDDHPLLLHHNTPKTSIYFTCTPEDVNALVLDISQAYVLAFGGWRHMTDPTDDINRAMPLVDLLQTGDGILGVMPKPAAERIGRVLEHHGLAVRLVEDTTFAAQDEHGRSRLAKLLLIDDSYFIALDFSVEYLGRV